MPYAKPGPRLLDSAGEYPLSDVVKWIGGIGSTRPVVTGDPVDPAAEEARKLPEVDTLKELGMGRPPEGYYSPESIQARQGERVSVPAGVTSLSPTSEDYLRKLHEQSMSASRDYLGSIKEKPHPMAQYKDVYDFASKAKPEELKAFIERNKDNPDLKGLGYIETTDPKTGKLRIEKVVSRPEEGGGIGKIPDMNASQMAAFSRILDTKAGIGARDIEERKLQFEIDKFAKSNDMKDPLNFMKLAASIAPKRKVSTPQEDGTTTTTEEPDVNAGVKMMEDMGYKPPAGIKAQVKKAKMTEVEARKALSEKKITGGDADKWIAEYKKQGVVQ